MALKGISWLIIFAGYAIVFPGFLGGVLFAMNAETTMDELEDKINRQRSGNIRNGISAFFDTKYKYKFTIFTDCIERKYGKDWLL